MTTRTTVLATSSAETPTPKSWKSPSTFTGVPRLKNCGRLGRGWSRALMCCLRKSTVAVPPTWMRLVSIRIDCEGHDPVLEVEERHHAVHVGVPARYDGEHRGDQGLRPTGR